MRFDVLTIFPEMFSGFLNHSILKRAREKKLVEIYVHDIRNYSTDKHKRVDDYPYGGGPGMVMMIEPIDRAISDLKQKISYDEIIFMTPDGIPFTQSIANRLSLQRNLLLLCGHYKGVDQRVRDNLVTMEISIGDYVLTGGELPAAVVIDAVTRLIPGVLHDETSALHDSFQAGLLSEPVYTRPSEYKGWKVPDILLSGDSKKIEEWRYEQAYKKTLKLRPDLLKKY
ncbi:MAG: tRNA (guanosine(37)-N1)-methyltransferase TrmD [Bacteroidales bacterium]|nr:tRNA (guanosine(37)-N1)-methyltransferase TrmD [Bacteroidales bacterium]